MGTFLSSLSPPPSPPPPSPSTPFSPFFFLPFELVAEIIESAVPLNFHSTTYRDRQRTLVSFCLVSRLFHQISKPLLFAVARLDPQNITSFLISHEEEEDSVRFLHEVIIKISCSPLTNGSAELMTFLYSPSRLNLLVIHSGESEVDIAKLAELERR